jgi:subtilisin family serine protease
MAMRFLDINGRGFTSDAIKCLRYVTLMRQRGVNVRVINGSWGGAEFDPALVDALEAAAGAGILYVASAGNGGADRVGDDTDNLPHYPSSYELANVVSVAATDANDARPAFSNFGRRSVDLGAPGDAILSTVPTSGAVSDPSGYRTARGTSMAAPHVSAVAALAFALAPRASVSPARGASSAGRTGRPTRATGSASPSPSVTASA